MDNQDEIKKNVYFKLCLMNYKKDVKETADALISYGICTLAETLIDSDGLSESDFEKDYDGVNDYDSSKAFHVAFMIACKILQVIPYWIEKQIRVYEQMKKFINQYESINGVDALVKIKVNVLWDVNSGKINERDFRVLCAIYSIIGTQALRRITIEQIRVRLQGYKSKAIFQSNTLNFPELSHRQISTTVKKLQKLKFFEMHTIRNRLTYYSRRYHGQAFINLIAERIAKSEVKRNELSKRNEQIQALVNVKVSEMNNPEYNQTMELVSNG